MNHISDINSAKILVVDDDPHIRELITSVIHNKGYEVGEAVDGIEALEKLESNSYDVVLADISMPRMGGIELIKEVKSKVPDLPMLAITAYPSLDIGLQAMKEGASDFIAKPFNIHEIELCIERMLNERRLLLERKDIAIDNKEKRYIERLNEELYKKVKESAILKKISENINNANENMDLLTLVMEIATEIVKVEIMITGVINNDRFYIKQASGLKGNVSVPVKGTVLEKAILEKKLYIDKSVNKSPFVNVPIKSSLLVIPMMIKGDVFGLTILMNKTDGTDFGHSEINMLSTLIDKACLKLENNSLYQSICDYFVNTLHSFVATIEAKDPYTKNHSENVASYALDIAELIGLDYQKKDAIRFAGYLHDIGKIGVREKVLNKPGSLTEDEYEEIKKHVVIGDKILKPVNLFLPIESSIVKHHHEWFNGSGYPDGLKGEEIPLLARITAIADAYDALTSTRPYRKQKTHDDAMNEILFFSGKQFDPELVKAFQKTPTGKGKKLN